MLALVVGLVAVSDQSLWIDELGTWRLTRADDLSAWLTQLLRWPNSDAQLPVYHGWIKLWASCFGTNEWALRASNLPWLLLIGWAFWVAPVEREDRVLARLAGVVCLLHPLTWYYTNELRPYVMLLAASALAGVGLLGIAWPARPNGARAAWHLLIVGCALLSVTSAIGAIWVLAFLPASLWLARRDPGGTLGLGRSHIWTFAVCAVCVLPVLIQYLHSFVAGVGATTLHEHKLVNFAFAFYELTGLSGLGPGREILRVDAIGAMREQAAWVAAGALPIFCVAVIGLRALWKRQGSDLLIVLGWALVPVLILLGLAELKHWRVVGRHLLPLLFFVCLVLAAGAHWAFTQTSSRWSRVLAVGMFAALLVSSLSIRFAHRHEREEYRDAAAAAAQSVLRGQIVWWFADAPGPEYYGLGARVQKLVPIELYEIAYRHLYDGMLSRIVTDCSDVGPGTVLILESPNAEMLAGCPPADRVIYSRQDTFDTTGAGMAWMRARGMHRQSRFTGFEIWQ